MRQPLSAPAGRRPTRALAAAAAVALLGACGSAESPDVTALAEGSETETLDPNVAPQEASEPNQEVEAFQGDLRTSQQNSDGSTVTVDRAGLENSRGWLVIRTSLDEEAATVLGTRELGAAGPLDDVEVELDPPLDSGEHTLFAVIHLDADPIGDFNWPGEDVPVVTRQGDVIAAQFRVTVNG